ncbi:ABC transporter ATP-binding protein [Rhizocola hellebori]|uniref:ABC transporter ATP-binding protein n=1 Tax=Rhizocola hellebori TaxID=1392758 RepID=A0A8J3VMN7_9ACTN|nr:ABC transporter ATP-binding protein [Rhizocola hellebori]GIH11516.1 ABC transporter ATP-binding protein [Rhizocola hellebori]
MMATKAETAMLETRSLRMAYGRRVLWTGLDMSVKSGRMVALTGPSGSGKSTLLGCLGLLERPTAGEILLDGRELSGLSATGARRLRRDSLGYLFQNYALVENATIAQNLNVALKARGRRGAQGQQAMEEALEKVGLAGRQREQVSRLSGGEQQRVAVARLLVKQPRLVLADEPTGALDRFNAELVAGLLRAMADDGACVVMATHNDSVRDQCDETVPVDAYTG